jgi:hypothetical protein
MASLDTLLLQRALRAACHATRDADTQATSAREMQQLNEQWAQSYIGFALNDLFRSEYGKSREPYVTFETSVSWLDGYIVAHDRPGPRPGSLKPRQRFDVVAWSKGGSVAGLVELKDRPVMSRYAELADPRKLCGALRRWPTVRWSMFIFSIRSAKATRATIESNLEEKRDAAFTRIREIVGDFWSTSESKTVPAKGSRVMWAGAVFRKPRKGPGRRG